MRYRYIGDHPEDLDGGRVLEPGGFVELSGDEVQAPAAARYIVEGSLIEAPEPQQSSGRTATNGGGESS